MVNEAAHLLYWQIATMTADEKRNAGKQSLADRYSRQTITRVGQDPQTNLKGGGAAWVELWRACSVQAELVQTKSPITHRLSASGRD